jgi:hypothetical protein
MYDDPPRVSPRVRTLATVLAVSLLAYGLFAAARYVRNRPPPDMSDRFADVAPFANFFANGEFGWQGQVTPGWAGATDPAVAKGACEHLASLLHPTGVQSVRIEDAHGEVIVECQ